MVVIEAQAGNYWCPFASLYVFSTPVITQIPTTTGGPGNRWIDGADSESNPPECRCLGAQCMAWIWVSPLKDDPNRTGCCGLAHTRTGGNV